MSNLASDHVIGVILAGGLSRRMEGPEKSLMYLNEKPLVQLACERLENQIPTVILNANGDPGRFSFLQNPVQADIIEGFAGPLAGIVSAMHWAKENAPTAQRVVTAPADTPFFPTNLAERFESELRPLSTDSQNKSICLAYSDGNRHPVFGSWPVALYDDLLAFLTLENERKVMLFAQRYSLLKIDFTGSEAFDPFFNINTPDDFETAKSIQKAAAL